MDHTPVKGVRRRAADGPGGPTSPESCPYPAHLLKDPLALSMRAEKEPACPPSGLPHLYREAVILYFPTGAKPDENPVE